MRKIKRLRFIGFIITLATIFGLLSVFGSTVAFAAEDLKMEDIPLDEFAELLAFNDDAFNSEDDMFNYNFGIEYYLSAGETVYIRVTGNEAHSMGTVYNFQVEKAR